MTTYTFNADNRGYDGNSFTIRVIDIVYINRKGKSLEIKTKYGLFSAYFNKKKNAISAELMLIASMSEVA